MTETRRTPRTGIKSLLLAALLALFPLANATAQPLDANHPELGWMTFETEHFIIHYHDGAQRTASVIAKIAEEVHPKVTAFYGYAPDTKFHFIVKDTDDYANGAAYYYNNKMLIWATALDYDLRGTKNWLRDVITHEYTHIIQLGAARKLPRNIPQIYLQVLGYEEEKRPDVLYGFPNVLASYPLAMTVMPNWFAEGTAQYNSPELRYDWWDSHRDMQLRVRALADSILPLNEMEVFGKNSLGNEGVYNHGFSLVSYIAEEFGPESLAEITRQQSRLLAVDLNESIARATGVTGEEVYRRWSEKLKREYTEATETIRAHEVEGELLKVGGTANLYAKYSPDGEWVYFTGNRGEDYFSQRSLWRVKVGGSGEPEKMIALADGPFDFSPDGEWLVYSKITPQITESFYADIYLYNIEKKKEYRLTTSARAMEPSFSPDGSQLAVVVNADGTKDLALLNLPEVEQWHTLKAIPRDSLTPVTQFNDGRRAYRPRWNASGDSLLFAMSTHAGRDIMIIGVDSNGMRTVIGGDADQRDPVYDGESILYSSDETGIFNLYRFDPETGESSPITNTVGGAVMPYPNPTRDEVLFSQWSINGYRLRTLAGPEPIEKECLKYGRNYLEDLPKKSFDDSDVVPREGKPYRPMFEQLFFVPRLTMDYGTFKPGVYIYSSDFLEKLNLFAGFNINRDGEYDAMGTFEFKALRPTIFAEGYWIRRTSSERFEDDYVIIDEKIDPETGDLVPVYDDFGVDYAFSLLEFDLGARMWIGPFIQTELRSIFSRYQSFLTYEDASVFQYTYFKGKTYQARFDYNDMPSQIHGNVHPHGGTRAQLTVAREDNQFIDDFTVESSVLQEVYVPYRYWRVEADVTHWYKLAGDLVVQPRLRGGYLDHQVDPFMHLYIGGLYGMRGYSYYALGGTRSVIGSVAFRHPIWTPNRPRFGWLHFDGLFLGLFADVGDAWRERSFETGELKRDIGAELRIKLYSWNGYPTALTFAAARGLDKAVITENNLTTEYEPQWRFYATLLFDFETIFPERGAVTRRIR